MGLWTLLIISRAGRGPRGSPLSQHRASHFCFFSFPQGTPGPIGVPGPAGPKGERVSARWPESLCPGKGPAPQPRCWSLVPTFPPRPAHPSSGASPDDPHRSPWGSQPVWVAHFISTRVQTDSCLCPVPGHPASVTGSVGPGPRCCCEQTHLSLVMI